MASFVALLLPVGKALTGLPGPPLLTLTPRLSKPKSWSVVKPPKKHSFLKSNPLLVSRFVNKQTNKLVQVIVLYQTSAPFAAMFEQWRMDKNTLITSQCSGWLVGKCKCFLIWLCTNNRQHHCQGFSILTQQILHEPADKLGILGSMKTQEGNTRGH